MNNYRIHFVTGKYIDVYEDDYRFIVESLEKDASVVFLEASDKFINLNHVTHIEKMGVARGAITRTPTPEMFRIQEEKEKNERTKDLSAVMNNAQVPEV